MQLSSYVYTALNNCFKLGLCNVIFLLFIFYITWLHFCAGVETSTVKAAINPTTFQSVLQHTQVFHDQHPLPKQLHTPPRQPEPSYHLLSRQHTQQPSSYRHESDISPVGPLQEVTSQGNLWGSWQSFAFLSACSSVVLVSDTLFWFLLVINYCYLHRTYSHSVQLCAFSGVGAQSGQDQILHPPSQGKVNHIFAVITTEKWTTETCIIAYSNDC